MQERYTENRALSFTKLKKNMKILMLIILITFTNFIMGNKTKNFLASKKTGNKILEETKTNEATGIEAAEDSENKAISFAKEKSTLAGLTRATAVNVAFVQMHKSTKTNNKLSLNSTSQTQAELRSMKKILEVVKEGLTKNQDLPKVSPSIQSDLSYLEKRTYETPITTEEFSTDLRLSKEQLGRFTWAVLHSMASSFPLVADEKDQNAMKSFIENM